MVKRNDAIKTSQGRVRDTDTQPVQPDCQSEADDRSDLHEGRYKPEMGTIIIKDYPPARSES